jgi:aspartyl-tRNA(Asn)/glutamyl-tRNA(Gln) amidotransferase subunit C
MDVKHIARLANLTITPAEEQKFTRQFSDTLQAIDLIKDLDTSHTKASVGVTGLTNVTRSDRIDESRVLPQSAVLGSACKTHNGFVVVPAVLEQ